MVYKENDEPVISLKGKIVSYQLYSRKLACMSSEASSATFYIAL